MIAFGAFADLAGVSNDFIDFIGNANLALFVGLLWAFLLARRSIGVERTATALSEGFRTSGEILLITGVGGSLGAVINASGMDAELGSLFSADVGGAGPRSASCSPGSSPPCCTSPSARSRWRR